MKPHPFSRIYIEGGGAGGETRTREARRDGTRHSEISDSSRSFVSERYCEMKAPGVRPFISVGPLTSLCYGHRNVSVRGRESKYVHIIREEEGEREE